MGSIKCPTRYLHVLAAAMLVLALSPNARGDEPAAVSRPGYMIVIGLGVDPAKMGEYAKKAVPLLLKAKGKLLFATEEGAAEVIEGGPFPGGIRVIEFPSLQAARDFYYSAEYQAAIPLREGNGKLDVILADGFIPDPKWFKPSAADAANE